MGGGFSVRVKESLLLRENGGKYTNRCGRATEVLGTFLSPSHAQPTPGLVCHPLKALQTHPPASVPTTVLGPQPALGSSHTSL